MDNSHLDVWSFWVFCEATVISKFVVTLFTWICHTFMNRQNVSFEARFKTKFFITIDTNMFPAKVHTHFLFLINTSQKIWEQLILNYLFNHKSPLFKAIKNLLFITYTFKAPINNYQNLSFRIWMNPGHHEYFFSFV